VQHVVAALATDHRGQSNQSKYEQLHAVEIVTPRTFREMVGK
jgi:hypothetical protein